MKRILIVKVTSLGDIVETQPVVTDLRRAFPSAKIDWAADAAFADIIRWNPAVDRVLSAPLRNFKKARSWSDLRTLLLPSATCGPRSTTPCWIFTAYTRARSSRSWPGGAAAMGIKTRIW